MMAGKPATADNRPAVLSEKTPQATTTGPESTAENGPAGEKDLLSFFSGALIVKKTSEDSVGWRSENVIDENPATGWASRENEIANQSFVIELPERTLVRTLVFDLAHTDGELRSARDITVEISDTGDGTGFQELARVALKDKADGQRFAVTKTIPGRFIRLSFGKNQGASDYVELMEVRGYGEQLTKTPPQNLSGTYDTDYGDFHIKQEGNSVIGCYEHKQGLLKGGIEEHILKLNWSEEGDASGPAVMVFSSDGQKMVGLWWERGQDILANAGGTWNGTKKSADVGSCPNLPNLARANSTGGQMADDLKQKGRAVIYGINFDTGSDAIRPESRSTLDQIVAVLKENKDWRMTVEGHTDDVGGTAPNQKLSESRAAAVMAYLISNGIESARLTSAGFGMSKPIAANDSSYGRAQNRRVELVRN